MSLRKDKLILLQNYLNLETGEILKDSFVEENLLYERGLRKKSLDDRIAKCKKCPGLNITRLSENCPAWGDLLSPLFFIGQSLHMPGMATRLPFILGSGFMLDAALRIIGLTRWNVFITNVVHCHPPNNRPSTMEEKENCLPYLVEEIDIVKPKMIIALGNDATWAIQKMKLRSKKEQRILKVKHPASFFYSAPEKRVEWILKLATEMEKVT